MEPKTKQYLLITVVGVTLFVALLRLSSVLAFAAQLVDLVLPILAGGILALFINVPMTGLEKRLKRLFCKAKKQPSDKVLHLLSFFITLLGVVLVLVLALTLLIPELVQSFHSLYVQIEANIPRWTAYLSAQDADMGWLMSWLEGIDWEQLLHRVTDSIEYPASQSVSKPACIRAQTPPQSTACSPNKSVSVSVLNVVSRRPALAPPIPAP